MRVDSQPVVDPEVRVGARRPVAGVVAVLAVATRRALPIGFVEPVGGDPLRVVVGLEILLPDELAAARRRRIDSSAAEVRVNQAAGGVESGLRRRAREDLY